MLKRLGIFIFNACSLMSINYTLSILIDNDVSTIICLIIDCIWLITIYGFFYSFEEKEDKKIMINVNVTNGNELKVLKLNELAIIPTRGSDYSAGLDLYSADAGVVINPGETKFIGTGLAMEPPAGTFIAIVARSGLSTKQGLAPANKFGVVDEDYRGEVKVALYNQSSEPRTINYGDRIAQAIVMPYILCDVSEVTELSDSDRGENGFGSTGK